MRALLVAVVVAVAGCAGAVPPTGEGEGEGSGEGEGEGSAYSCSGVDQCWVAWQIGAGVIRQCTSSSDCTDPASGPHCVDFIDNQRVCVFASEAPQDCGGPAGPEERASVVDTEGNAVYFCVGSGIACQGTCRCTEPSCHEDGFPDGQ